MDRSMLLLVPISLFKGFCKIMSQPGELLFHGVDAQVSLWHNAMGRFKLGFEFSVRNKDNTFPSVRERSPALDTSIYS